LLYFLMFAFGYMSCRTFYFLRSTRTSIKLVKAAQLIGLGILARSMENFHYAGTYRIQQLNQGGFSDNKIKSFKIRFEDELSSYKDRSIREIINNHEGVFKGMVDFKDWNSAMLYLETNRRAVNAFFLKEDR